MSKVVAVIQARLTSSRFPRKILESIGSRSVLEHVVRRCGLIKGVAAVVVAVPDDDTELFQYCKERGIVVFAGSEDDVLARTYHAASPFNPDAVVRITSDCPLTDPRVATRVLQYFWQVNADYVSNNLIRCFPVGYDTEVIRFSSLKDAFENASTAKEREHVTPYLRHRPTLYSLGTFVSALDLSEVRVTVDTPDDLEHVRFLVKKYGEDLAIKDLLLYSLRN